MRPRPTKTALLWDDGGSPALGVGRGLSLLWSAGLCGFLALGCVGEPGPPPTPEATVMAFARALNRAKLEDAYALMSRDYKKRVSFAQFKRQLEGNAQETLEVSNALSHVRGHAEQRATLVYADDQELELRREGEQWLITTPVVDFYDRSTPRSALRSFVRALEHKRYDVVMGLIPKADQEGITTDRMEQAWSGEQREEIERMLNNLRQHLQDPIEVVGNHATMPYGDHLRVQFTHEADGWKIEDPE
jgi:hypothetical protein